jgi:orotidine 5'-phosphate decarboxylase subfamily 2
MNRFLEMTEAKISENNSLVCVGLDLDPEAMPEPYKSRYRRYQIAGSEQDKVKVLCEFNRWIIEETAPYVCTYKPNLAYYEALGSPGMSVLLWTVDELHRRNFAVIGDAKKGDIFDTQVMYAKAIFEVYDFDATTINIYMGDEVAQPFLERYKDRFTFVLTRTSNPGSGYLQNLLVKEGDGKEKYLYQIVVEKAKLWNAQTKNCGLVVGATYPEEMEVIRKMVPEMWFLVPGFGLQEGDPRVIVPRATNNERKGFVASSSRAIIYMSDPAEAAKKLRDEINQYRWKR